MKPNDLKPCAGCGKGLMHAGDICFYEVALTQHLVDMDAVRQLAGLEMMMGGKQAGVAVARALSSVQEISQEVWTNKLLLCQGCALGGRFDVALVFPNE